MTMITIWLIAFALAMDAFAVAVSSGAALKKLSLHPVFRLSWHFGFFQFIMPVIGYSLGISVRHWITPIDHWVAFGLLAFVGAKMIYESFQPEHKRNPLNPTKGLYLVMLSIATSIDALAVGITMALLDMKIVLPCIIIGCVAAAMTVIGMLIGRKLGSQLGRKTELLGGLILVAIGLKILTQHLTQ